MRLDQVRRSEREPLHCAPIGVSRAATCDGVWTYLAETDVLELVRVEDLEEAESGVSDILNIMTICSRYKADISGLLPTISTIFTKGG